MYTNPPTWESAPERTNLIVGSRGSDQKPAERGARGIVPSWTPPPCTTSQHSHMGCPGEHLRLRPLLHKRHSETKKMAQMKEQIKAPEKNRKTKWWRDSQPIRWTVQTTCNQDAHRSGWIWSQIRWKNEGYAKRNKGNAQGTNSDGKETRTQIIGREQKEKINIQPGQNEETRIQKEMSRGLGTSRTSLNIPTFKT